MIHIQGNKESKENTYKKNQVLKLVDTDFYNRLET